MVGMGTKKVNWVLDADIRRFYDILEHGWLVRFVKQRIAVITGCAWMAGAVRLGGYLWRTVLRPSQPQGNHLPWRRMARFVARWLTPVCVCHPYLGRYHPR